MVSSAASRKSKISVTAPPQLYSLHHCIPQCKLKKGQLRPDSSVSFHPHGVIARCLMPGHCFLPLLLSVWYFPAKRTVPSFTVGLPWLTCVPLWILSSSVGTVIFKWLTSDSQYCEKSWDGGRNDQNTSWVAGLRTQCCLSWGKGGFVSFFLSDLRETLLYLLGLGQMQGIKGRPDSL